MRNRELFKKKSFLITAFINILLLILVVFLMNHVQHLLNSDAKINLTEIVTQNKDVIASKLMLEVNNLELMSEQLSERFSYAENTDAETQKSIFLDYVKEKLDNRISWAAANGDAVFANGQEINISGRKYFRLAMDGIQNISDRTISRLTGDDIFVISVPLKDRKGNVIGTIQKQYTPQEMYDICSVSLFSEQGSMYIINSQGYILISSQQERYSREADNYYRMIYLTNPEASKRLEEDIRDNRSGFMETEINGKKIFSAYTAIDQVYDWYLISSVDTGAVSPNANVVFKLFYVILIGVVLVFGFSMLYYLRVKNKQQAYLKEIAFVDSVTKGNTLAKFAYDVPMILSAESRKKFYIFAFDIDNFKYINSYYGFDVGDNVLRKISEKFGQNLLPNERLARVASDHFVMLLEDNSEKHLEEVFQWEICIDDIDVYLSGGLYPITDHNESIKLMTDKAKMAAQTMKGLRYKKIAVYSEEFDHQMMQDEQTKRSIELALANNEIVPYFQPKIDIHNNKLVGAEALARWCKDDGTLISPIEFIPICEKTGLIVSIDITIFEKTLQFIRKNLDQGVQCVPISVNFSRLHLSNKDFISTLLSKLQEYQVPPELIELELTETAIFENYQRVEDFIYELHRNGFLVSMDDFGSGYSSLYMLKDIDIDILKIDGGFLSGTANSKKQRTIFKAIVQMADELEMKVVVEGVECQENVELMKEFGCSIAQGYYYAKPMAQHDFEKVYKEGLV